VKPPRGSGMKRTFLVATLAIGVLLGGGVALVLLLTRSPPMAAPPDLQPAPEPQISIAPAPPEPPAEESSRPPVAERRPETRRRSGTARGTWDAPAGLPSTTPMADRVTRKAVRKALVAGPVQSRLARCVDGGGGFGGAPSELEGPPPADPASLVIELETLGAEVRILDARVREWGGASEAMVACARTVLRGQVVPTPALRRPPGERLRMPFPLNPRRAPVASR
jgi:hypothetical protein